MLKSRSRRSLVLSTILSLFVAIVLPTVTFAGQGRGQDKRGARRYERQYDRRDYTGYGNYGNEKRKKAKFINGHDARDGRWDGRGPNRNRSFDRWDRERERNRSAYRNRRRYQNRSETYGRSYDNYNYRGTSSNVRSKDILGGILGNILSGYSGY